MGKFSPRRIIAMIILLTATLAGITLGVLVLGHHLGPNGVDKSLLSTFDKKTISELPHNNYWGRMSIAYYGGIGALASGIFAGVLFIIGIVLTLIKGKSFGWLMLIIGLGLLMMSISTGIFSLMAVKDLSNASWLLEAKNWPNAPVTK